MTKITITVDTDNPIHTAEGTIYYIPELHDHISEPLLKKLQSKSDGDYICRNDMLDAIGHGTTYTSEELQEIVRNLPSVETSYEMCKEKRLKIGLALNAIACMLDDDSFHKIRGRLDEIQEIIINEPEDSNEDSGYVLKGSDGNEYVIGES